MHRIIKTHLLPLLPVLLPVAATALPARAQFDQNIAVEGRYVPEIINLDRINTFPQRERFELTSHPLAFDGTGVPAAFEPRMIAMPATGWRATRELSRRRGYVDFMMGSWLNTDLSAGYRFIDNATTVAGVRLQHTSTSLWKPKLSEATRDVKQQRYDQSVGLYGSHHFADRGRLDASLDYHLGYFNYYGWSPYNLMATTDGEKTKAPTQTLNDFSARLLWQSESRPDNINWHVGAGVRYFAYRACPWAPESTGFDTGIPTSVALPSGTDLKGSRETDVNLNAAVFFPLSSTSGLGIDLDADLLLYGGGLKKTDTKNESLADALADIDNYGVITLTPYWRLSRSKLNVRLGLNADIAANAGPDGNRYAGLHVSPDVALDYNAGPVQLFVHILGGTRLNTLAAGYELDYYQQPALSSTMPVFTPFEGSAGISAGPFAGVSAGVDFTYKVVKNQHLGGWYTALLNYGDHAMSGLPATTVSYLYMNSVMQNTHGWSVGFNLKADFGRAFSLEGRAAYQPQRIETGFFNGFDRPRWTLQARAVSNPWSTLRLELGYEYRGVRNILLGAVTGPDEFGFYNLEETSMRLPDLCLLSFGASYDFTDRFTARLSAANLLNSHAAVLPCQPSQGVAVAAGISYRF